MKNKLHKELKKIDKENKERIKFLIKKKQFLSKSIKVVNKYF